MGDLRTVADLLGGEARRDVASVIDRMVALSHALPREDGVHFFNEMYLETTRSVAFSLAAGQFARPDFVEMLDVAFAELYFDAVRAAAVSADAAPRAWAPLFACRRRGAIAPLQFALCGMNAHINRDLPIAVVRTCRALALAPDVGTSHHADYLAVNTLLALTEARVKAELSVGWVNTLDVALGQVDDSVALWSIERARDAAWVNAQMLWHLRDRASLTDDYVAMLDRMVGFAGRGLLLPAGALP